MFKSSALILSIGLATFTIAQAQTSPAPASGAGAINDSQIAMIAVVADSIDIDAGKLAAQKASSKEVKEFAETMVRDHTAVNGKATALAKKLNVTPEES